MYMKLKDGKSKVLTLSYDDGVIQDIRLIGILDKYGIKGTFNINTGSYFPEDKTRETPRGRLKLSESQKLYINSGHEVATHALTHAFLEELRPDEVITEIITDRKNIEAQYGSFARGHAYPYGSYSDEVVDCLAKCGICYARTVKSTGKFDFPENWLKLHPTCHHNSPELMTLANKFIDITSKYPFENWMFYLWGHSYEFDNDDNWDVIENFAKTVGGRDDIWYATNIEIYDYVKAYESLQTTVDNSLVHNPTATDVWFVHNKITYCVKAGETIRI
ncbi:MAG: polysaccharide deacetylase family protein [Clostridia bacterium]|nr:polysaccharide deacetylase family protein [Clostridia bacterium]